MAELPPSLAGLSLAEKRLLLAQLLQEEAQRPEGPAFPLSHGQRGLWFLYQLDPGSPAYNVCFPTRIRAPLDLPAYRRSLQALVDRHASLRTTFEQLDGALSQRVHEGVPVCFEHVDASSWSEQGL